MVEVVGWTLVVGCVVFLIGAGGWRLAYELPPEESLPIIHEDRRRRAWIHLWMVPAMFLTSAGLAGLVLVVEGEVARALTAMAAVVYALGAVCWVASLVFRLTVVPWAAEHVVSHGTVPDAYPPLDRWASALYVVHMVSAYVAFAVLGLGLLQTDLPTWLGWVGAGVGSGFTIGFVATRAAGPFNPPFWAHTYTAAVGVVLLVR